MARKKEKKQPLRLEWRRRGDLHESDLNWRVHPPEQMQVLSEAMQQVGWAGALLFNESTGRLVDGAARLKVSEDPNELLPVLVGNWTEEQEKLILATLDPLAAIADTDKGRLHALLAGLTETDGALGEFLDSLAENEKLELNALLETAETAEGEVAADQGQIDEADFVPSHVRMVQLFLDIETLAEYLLHVEVLQPYYKTDNPTDTVMEALRRESAAVTERVAG